MAAAAVDSKAIYADSSFSTSQTSFAPSTAHSHTTLTTPNGHTLAYQQATPGIHIVAVDGADDEEADIVFSDPAAGKRPLFALSKRSAEEVHSSSKDINLINCQTEQVSAGAAVQIPWKISLIVVDRPLPFGPVHLQDSL